MAGVDSRARGRSRLDRVVLLDIAPLVVLVGIGLAEALGATADVGVHVAGGLLQTAAVGGRRRWPLPALLVSLAGILIESIWAVPFNGLAGLLAVMLLTYSVPRHAPRQQWWPAVVVLGVGTFARFAASADHPLGDVFFSVVLFGAAWAGGAALRNRHERLVALEREVELADQRRYEEEAAIVADERRRIARDLHDVVGHALSAISLTAGAAEQQAPHDSELRASLVLIRTVSQDAVAEMRRLVGLLRTSTDPVELAPQPRLDRLQGLIDNSRAAGLEVDLVTEGAPVDLPPGMQIAAYRVVQEGLTNIAKHAGRGTPASVALRWQRGHLDIHVDDQGPGPDPASRPGHGLVGLRERLAMYNGVLEAGGSRGGGYRLHARLPVP